MLNQQLLQALDRWRWTPSQLARELGVTGEELTALLTGSTREVAPQVQARLTSMLQGAADVLPEARQSTASRSAVRPYVVGISGASCCGKTWLANTIRRQRVDDCEVMDLDGYYRDLPEVEPLEHGHDNPASIHFDRAAADLARLVAGQSVPLPVYSFEEHRITGSRTVHPKRLIVVEGLFVFADARIRERLDLKIWMESSDELRWDRRIWRDTRERERTVEEIQDRYSRDVLPGYQKFVQPLRAHADVILGNEGRDNSDVPKLVNLILGYLERRPMPIRPADET